MKSEFYEGVQIDENVDTTISKYNFQSSIDELFKKQKSETSFFGKSDIFIPAQFRKLTKDSYEEITRIAQKQLKELQALPFWLTKHTPKEHERVRMNAVLETGKPLCCFCHAVGLPEKNLGGKIRELPIFDYEIEMMRAYRNYKRVFIRKPRGFGGTTFNNYYLAYFAIKNGQTYNGYRVMYVSGIGYDAAIDMIFRLKQIFMKNYPELIMSYYNTTEDQAINGILFKAFAGANIRSLRHYANVLALVVDEGDLFDLSVVKEILGVISVYEEKSNALIVLMSTAYLPDGLFYNIEFETSEDYKGWHKLLYDYTAGMNRIYDADFIKREENKSYFLREYLGKYVGNLGTMFPHGWLSAARELSKLFPSWKTLPVMPNMVHFIGVDPAWGASERASKFSITVTRYNPAARYGNAPADYYVKLGVPDNSDYNLAFNADMAETVAFLNKEHPTVNEAINDCMHFYNLYGRKNVYFVVDGSAIPFIELLKSKIPESSDYLSVDPEFWIPSQGFKVTPVLPNEENNQNMRKNAYNLLSARMWSIPEEFNPIHTGFGSANGQEFKLDKKKSAETDALDSSCLSVYFLKEHATHRKILYSKESLEI